MGEEEDQDVPTCDVEIYILLSRELIIFFLRIDYWADRIEFKIRVIFPLVGDWFQKNPGPNF